MKLLFLNSLKGLKKKKIQMLGIILLVMLSTGIYVAMSSGLDRLEEKYYSYLEEQNVEYLSVDTIIDYEKDVTKEDMDYIMDNYFTNLTEEENSIINSYRYILDFDEETRSSLIENPFNNPAFQYMLANVFQKYEADIYIKKLAQEQNILFFHSRTFFLQG